MDNISLLQSGTTYSLANERKASRRDRRRAVRAYSRMFFALAVFQIVSTLSASFIQVAIIFLFGQEMAEEIISNPYVMMGMQVLCLYVLAFPIFYLCCLGLPKSKHVKSKMSFGEFFVLFLVGQASMSIVNLIAQPIVAFIEKIIGVETENAVDALLTDTPMWLVIAVAVIIGPIVEELMFRKILFDRMSVYGDRMAILVTSVAFGIFHGNLNQLFYTTCFGLILGYAYARTRRIKYPILLHMIANFFGSVPGLLLMKYAERFPELDPESTVLPEMTPEFLMYIGAMLLYLFLTYGLGVAGIVVLIVLLCKRRVHVPRTCEVRLPVLTLPRVTIFNLGAIIFGLIMLFIFASPYIIALGLIPGA